MPWIANPFRDTLEVRVIEKQTADALTSGNTGGHATAVAGVVNPLALELARDEAMERHKQGELPIQLLYDLFFVANLAAITSDKAFYDANSQLTLACILQKRVR